MKTSTRISNIPFILKIPINSICPIKSPFSKPYKQYFSSKTRLEQHKVKQIPQIKHKTKRKINKSKFKSHLESPNKQESRSTNTKKKQKKDQENFTVIEKNPKIHNQAKDEMNIFIVFFEITSLRFFETPFNRTNFINPARQFRFGFLFCFSKHDRLFKVHFDLLVPPFSHENAMSEFLPFLFSLFAV